MMQCPACQRLLDGNTDTCPRCGAELATRHALLATADRHLRMGTRRLAQRDPTQALRLFRAACRITPTTEAQQGRAVAAMCTGHFHEALRSYFTANPATPSE